MSYLRILGTILRLNILNELMYRSHIVMQIFQSLVMLGSSLIGLQVVFTYTSRINGWRAHELLALLGLYFIVGGMINSLIQPSIQQFLEGVHQGSFDFTLVKPLDSQFLVSTQNIQIWKAIDCIIGAVLLGVGLSRLSTEVTLPQLLAFAITLFAGGAIVYSFWLMLATTAFWWVRVETILSLFQSMFLAGRWPVTIYPPWLRWILTFLIPIAVAVTLPIEVLVDRDSTMMVAGCVIAAIVMLGVSRWLWRRGLQRYSGASA